MQLNKTTRTKLPAHYLTCISVKYGQNFLLNYFSVSCISPNLQNSVQGRKLPVFSLYFSVRGRVAGRSRRKETFTVVIFDDLSSPWRHIKTQLHSFLTLALTWCSGRFIPEKKLVIYWIEGWLDSRVGLEVLEKKTNFTLSGFFLNLCLYWLCSLQSWKVHTLSFIEFICQTLCSGFAILYLSLTRGCCRPSRLYLGSPICSFSECSIRCRWGVLQNVQVPSYCRGLGWSMVLLPSGTFEETRVIGKREASLCL